MWWTCMTTVVLPAPMAQCTIPMQLIQSYQMSPEAVDEISKIELTYIDLKWNSCIDLGMNLVSHITLCYKVWGFSIGQCFNHTVGHKLSERINAARIQMYEWNMLHIFRTKAKQTFGVAGGGGGGSRVRINLILRLPKCRSLVHLESNRRALLLVCVCHRTHLPLASPPIHPCTMPCPPTHTPPICHVLRQNHPFPRSFPLKEWTAYQSPSAGNDETHGQSQQRVVWKCLISQRLLIHSDQCRKICTRNNICIWKTWIRIRVELCIWKTQLQAFDLAIGPMRWCMMPQHRLVWDLLWNVGYIGLYRLYSKHYKSFFSLDKASWYLDMTMTCWLCGTVMICHGASN